MFQKLISMKIIKEDKYYEMALMKVRNLMKLKPDKISEQGQELEMLISLIEAHEDLHVPMQASDPIEFLKYQMEKLKLKQVDLIPFIGDKTKVSKVLNHKQGLTVQMISRLSRGLNIPVSFLIQANI